MCRGCKVVRFFQRVLYPPLGLRLLDWQERVLRAMYGTVRPEDGIRRYRRAYISVAKKNGKSFLIGGLPIYHLIMENDFQPKAYGAASAKKQAGEVFNSCLTLVRANPELKNRLKILESTKRLIRRDGGGFYEVVSADGDVNDGMEPSLVLIDELHRWKTVKARTLYNVMTKGVISRREPLIIEITTAGEEGESSVWWEEYELARQVLEGSIRSDRFYVGLWSADQKRLREEPDYWKSREARVAANPSHEDLGGFLTDEAIVEELDKAVASPTKKLEYLRYHLNVAVSQEAEPAVEMDRWKLCDGGVDLRKWPEYDLELLVRKWNLIEKRCYVGVDASWTTDLSAAVLVFPPNRETDAWTLLPMFFMAQETLAERERKDKVPYREWARMGFIRATPGDVVDTREIQKFILWAKEMFDLAELDYDRCNFNEAAQKLQDDEDVKAVRIAQTFLELSPATKKLLELYRNPEMLRHGNNPVLNWCAANLSLKADGKDNVQPAKPNRTKSRKRIDGISATVNAIAGKLVAEPEPEGCPVVCIDFGTEARG